MKTMTLADGRELAYETFGDPSGSPVIFCHGFGDSRLIRNPDERLTESLGVHVAVADQPGVGGSSPQPGRTMADWGPDMKQLADHLGIEQFAVAGHSGGEPHSMRVLVVGSGAGEVELLAALRPSPCRGFVYTASTGHQMVS